MTPDDPEGPPPPPPPPPEPPPSSQPPVPPPSEPVIPPGPPPAQPPPGPPPSGGGFPWWVVVVTAVLVVGGIAGAVVAFSGGDERLSRAELVSRVETLCSDFRDESERLDEVSSVDDLQSAVDERLPLLDGLVSDFEALRPPEDDQEQFDRFVADVEGIRDANRELGERVSADTTFGDVITLLAQVQTSGAEANEALDDLGAEPCDDPDAEAVTAEELRSNIGEAFFAEASIPSTGVADVECVTDGFVGLRLDVVLSFQDAESQADLPAGALGDLAAVLDDCVPLVPVLEQVFLTEGIPPDTASCLADAAASRLGWEGILQAGLGGDTSSLEAEIEEAAAGCPGPGGA